MTTVLKWAALVCALVLVLATASFAQGSKCGKHSKMVQVLAERYKETPRVRGLSSESKLAMELYASSRGSWTVLMTMTNGLTCVMASGHSFEDLNSGDQS